MTKEQCSLQPNYYGSSCDFQDLQSAVQQLTTKSDAQFEELKNEKWFHRTIIMEAGKSLEQKTKVTL